MDATLSESSENSRRFHRRTIIGYPYDPAEDKEPLPDPPQPPKSPELIQEILEKMGNSMSGIDQPRKVKTVTYMTKVPIKRNEILFKKGDKGTEFFVIVNGTFEVETKKGIKRFDNQGALGTRVLMYDYVRPHTVKATTDGVLYKIGIELYTRILVKMAYEKRMRQYKFIEETPILATLEPYERHRLCDALDPVTYREGEIIVKQGDAAKGMYFVEKGVAVVVNENGDDDGPPLEFKSGSYFGERALIQKTTRAKTIKAQTAVEGYYLKTESFELLLGRCIDLMRRDAEHYEKHMKRFEETKNVP